MGKSKIDWCDMVFNPVWGCLNNCIYCYARKLAKRFGWQVADKENAYLNDTLPDSFYEKIINFEPTWLQSNYDKKFPKKPSRIFVDSMSDIEYWKPLWMRRVLNKIKEYPQHTFLFLTKYPGEYDLWDFPDNCWLGITITNQQDMNIFADLIFDTEFDDKHKIFLSIEPIQEKIKLYVKPDWIIIGAETGNRKDKIIPQPDWIEPFTKLDIPVFMKDNLRVHYNINKYFFKQEFPK